MGKLSDIHIEHCEIIGEILDEFNGSHSLAAQTETGAKPSVWAYCLFDEIETERIINRAEELLPYCDRQTIEELLSEVYTMKN